MNALVECFEISTMGQHGVSANFSNVKGFVYVEIIQIQTIYIYIQNVLCFLMSQLSIFNLLNNILSDLILTLWQRQRFSCSSVSTVSALPL